MSRRIIYIMPSCSDNSPGILKKNVQRVEALVANGCNVKGLFFTKDHEDVREIHPNILKIGYNDIFLFRNFPLLWRLIPMYSNCVHLKTINKWVSKEKVNYKQTFIYFRYPSASKFVLKLINKWKNKGCKIAFEMNGKEEAFLERDIRDNPSDLFAKKRLKYEQKYAPLLMKSIDLVVGVSNEIGAYYADMGGAHKYVLSNGFDINSVEVIEQEIKPNTTIKFCLISGSPNYWNGSDRYIEAFKKYSGNEKIELHLIGLFNPKYLTNLHPHIVSHGMLSKEKLDEILPQIHVGLGSVGLHRVDLKEGNVLKVREYLSRGLPVIIGYQDTDLNFDEPLDFVANVSANEQAIELPPIITWLKELYEKHSNLNIDIRAFASKKLSYHHKIHEFVTYLEKNKYV
jgi:hypothetical protein